MEDKNFIELYKKLEELIGYCYEKYKDSFEYSEREICEEYLYEQGEYELALDSFLAITKNHNTILDQECMIKIKEAKKLMNMKN